MCRAVRTADLGSESKVAVLDDDFVTEVEGRMGHVAVTVLQIGVEGFSVC